MKNNQIKQSIFIIISILSITTFSYAKSVIRVAISKGFKQKIVLIFPGTYSTGFDNKLSSEMDEILRIDLKLSGKISFIPGQRNINNIAKNETFEKTDINQWRKSGGEFLLKTYLSKDLGVPKLSWSLWDLTTGEKIKTKSRTSGMKDFRKLGHKISDEILVELTGEKGLGSTKIAFVSDTKKTKTIFSCDLQGKDLKQLIFEKSLTISPNWGPERESLLYTSYQNINPGIFIKYIQSNRVESVSLMPGLNANGKINTKNEVVFTASRDGNPEIYRKNIITGKIKRLTRRYGVDATPCWSPDNKKIAFVSSSSGTPQIYTMSRDGTNIQRLTKSGSYNASPDFSPNGRYLAFSAQIRRKLNILIYDFQRLTTDVLVSGMKNSDSPSFSPDSSHIAFGSDKGGTWNIYIINIETREITKVTKNFGNCTNPSWK